MQSPIQSTKIGNKKSSRGEGCVGRVSQNLKKGGWQNRGVINKIEGVRKPLPTMREYLDDLPSRKALKCLLQNIYLMLDLLGHL